jgi:hypothetical protein
MTKWINIKDENPPEYHDVLVCTNLCDDDWRNFFVATYFSGENEWIEHSHFSEENSPYIRVSRKALKDDMWSPIKWPER